MNARRLRAAALFLWLPLLQPADDTRTYVPPGEPGYVYTVIEHPARSTAAPRAATTVSVRWGAWRQTGRFLPGADDAGGAGIVLRLRHAKWDRFPLTVSTSGRIISGPLQGPAPPEWTQPRFARVIW